LVLAEAPPHQLPLGSNRTLFFGLGGGKFWLGGWGGFRGRGRLGGLESISVMTASPGGCAGQSTSTACPNKSADDGHYPQHQHDGAGQEHILGDQRLEQQRADGW
jgi:hypothetical protein